MSMYSNHGKVPMFRMKPQPGYLWAAIIVLLMGVLIYFEGHRDPGNVPAHERSTLILVISIIASGVLLIIATSRMWFKHLWHDRYR